MIEGLRVLPWLQEARRRKHSVDHLYDCGDCMERFDKPTRTAMGCGYERSINPHPWTPVALNVTWSGKQTTCPGYTTKLPEVIEIARARLHWKDGGGLRDFCDEPTEQLRYGVETLNGSTNECQSWSIENPEKK